MIPINQKEKGTGKRLPQVEKDVDWKLIHGNMGKKTWAMPLCVVECAKEARPDYNSMLAHEYEDDPETLVEKIKVVAQLLKQSRNAMAYTGAGISTSSGIDDYASKAKNTVAFSGRRNKKTGLQCDPSLGHRVLAQLWKK
eukprot:UN27972